MKTTPHTIFIYSWGNFLRIVRGEHTVPEAQTKPRVYPDLESAIQGERKRPKIVARLNLFPSDKHLNKRLKAIKAPVKVAQHRTLADAIRSSLFLYAQAGYDSEHKEIAYIYHRSPANHTGLVMAKSGPIKAARQLLKKYKKPPMRDFNYRDPTKRKFTLGEVA
jgi:hypothetical protein